MINFNYFMLNFSHGFIKECWKDNPFMAEHIEAKFLDIYKIKGTAVFPFFFCELDMDNQIKLSKWINENYLAFEHLNF